VAGTANGKRFAGYIGERWGRFFIIIDPELREAAGVSAGDTLTMIVQPTATQRALERAFAQSKLTTAPRKPRPDAIDPPRESRRKSRSPVR